MTMIILLLAITAGLALAGLVLVREIRQDGYGHRPPPRSHPDEEVVRAYSASRLTW